MRKHTKTDTMTKMLVTYFRPYFEHDLLISKYKDIVRFGKCGQTTDRTHLELPIRY